MVANVSPVPSAPNNFANNEFALNFTRKLWLYKNHMNSYNMLYISGEVCLKKPEQIKI